jgi:hypothetical protein
MTAPTAPPRPLPLTLRTAHLPTQQGFRPTVLSRWLSSALPSISDTEMQSRQEQHGISTALQMLAPVEEQSRRRVAIHCRMAVLMLRRQQAQDQHIAMLAYAANVALLLAEQGLGAELIDQIVQAQMAVFVLMQQYHTPQGVSPTDQMLRDLDDLVEILDAQTDSPDCTGWMVERAHQAYRDRVAAGEALTIAVPA